MDLRISIPGLPELHAKICKHTHVSSPRNETCQLLLVLPLKDGDNCMIQRLSETMLLWFRPVVLRVELFQHLHFHLSLTLLSTLDLNLQQIPFTLKS